VKLWAIEYRFKGQGSGAWFVNLKLVFAYREDAEKELKRRVKTYSHNTEYRIGEYKRMDGK
jgi:uncharacterized membrane protein